MLERRATAWKNWPAWVRCRTPSLRRASAQHQRTAGQAAGAVLRSSVLPPDMMRPVPRGKLRNWRAYPSPAMPSGSPTGGWVEPGSFCRTLLTGADVRTGIHVTASIARAGYGILMPAWSQLMSQSSPTASMRGPSASPHGCRCHRVAARSASSAPASEVPACGARQP